MVYVSNVKVTTQTDHDKIVHLYTNITPEMVTLCVQVTIYTVQSLLHSA